MSLPSMASVEPTRSKYVDDVELYRSDLRRYLAEATWVAEWRAATCSSAEQRLAYDASVLRRLYADGWNRYGWPEMVGGHGGDEIHRAAFYDELTAALLPVPNQQWTLETLGPALIAFAPQLAAERLGAYLRGEEWWGQGFSEPDAGSDLASLRTRALDDGHGGLVVSGQKIWTSQGGTAHRFVVLVRTGSTASRHRGLTMVLIDADAPGVTVRPIALASGRRELAEVFFDNVRVPAQRVIGDRDGGWEVAMYLMQYERGMYGYAVVTAALAQLSRLRATMVARSASAADKQRFARVYVATMVAAARGAATVRMLARGQTLGPASSIDKLLFTTVEKDIQDLIFDVRHDWMMNGADDADPADVDEVRADWWYARAATIMGGTAEVQKNIVADHVLGLPRGAQ
ncbi:acyl-CoA dehydrogenase family protein [Mycolicibacterium aichiense]|uniref:acyl-CoA dehydrogenase family protein n=1 Tax=Mycolicibacterium aichiense TaxID=1799 RepID=UPI003D672FA4